MKTFFIPLCAVALLLFSCNHKQERNVEKKLPVVEIIHPKQANIQASIAGSGMIAHSEELILSFKTGGIVEAVNVEEGEYIQKGRLLAQLNTTELDAQLEQVNLGVEKLKRDESRLQHLVKDTTATLEQLQNTQTALSAQEQQQQGIAFNRQQAFLYAPVSGFILKKQVNVGEFKTPGAMVFVMGSNDKTNGGKWIFKAAVSDQDRVKLYTKQQAIITLDAIPDRAFVGNIVKLATIPDAQTGTYDCYVSFHPEDANIVYGLSGKLTIPLQTENTYTELPLEALASANGKQAFIYLLNNDSIVEKRGVSIHRINKKSVSLKEILSDDLQIIISGKNDITVGQKALIYHTENQLSK